MVSISPHKGLNIACENSVDHRVLSSGEFILAILPNAYLAWMANLYRLVTDILASRCYESGQIFIFPGRIESGEMHPQLTLTSQDCCMMLHANWMPAASGIAPPLFVSMLVAS